MTDFKDKIVIDPALLKNIKGSLNPAVVDFVKSLARDLAKADYDGEIPLKTESHSREKDRHD